MSKPDYITLKNENVVMIDEPLEKSLRTIAEAEKTDLQTLMPKILNEYCMKYFKKTVKQHEK